MSIVVSKICIYPVKSCGGVFLQSTDLVPGGLALDRRYMLVDEVGGFISARTEPSLLQVSTELSAEAISLLAPGFQKCQVPSTPREGQLRSSAVSTVWRDTLTTFEHGEGSEWFSAYLKKPVRLVYQPSGSLRAVNPACAEEGDRVSLADGYPLLLTNEASLQELNQRLSSPVEMNRFRPNLVVSGATGFEEDLWLRLSINGISFRSPKLCDRCVMVTIDAQSGRPGKEPLKTLTTFRRWKGAVWFGSNLIADATGRMSVGDEVSVLDRRAHHPAL